MKTIQLTGLGLAAALIALSTVRLMAQDLEGQEVINPPAATDAPANANPPATPGASQPESGCVICHTKLDDESAEIVTQFKESIHEELGFSCVECHGGDPTTMDKVLAKSPASGYTGKPDRKTIPQVCARCHSDATLMRQYGNLRTDQLDLYQTSAHGIALLQSGDTNVATCTDCHTAHHILKVDNPKASVAKVNQPETCAKCHGDADLMSNYGLDPAIPSDYMASQHGLHVLEMQDNAAAVCSDCHGSHGARPPGVDTIQNVCGTCHLQTEKYYNSGPHAEAFASLGLGRCITCHDQHKLPKPTEAFFDSGEDGQCIICHAEDSPEYSTIMAIKNSITEIDGMHGQASELVEETEKTTHLSMFDMLPHVDQIHTKLLNGRALQHSLDIRAMQDNSAEAQKEFSAIQGFTLSLLERARFNKRMVLLLAVLLIAFGLYLVIYRKLVLDRTSPWVYYEGDAGEAAAGQDPGTKHY